MNQDCINVRWALIEAEQQPTSFSIATYQLTEVFNTPELITSLATYSESRPTSPSQERRVDQPRVDSDSSSLLFLQVYAAADYFTTNKTLMQNVPPVNIEISESDLVGAVIAVP